MVATVTMRRWFARDDAHPVPASVDAHADADQHQQAGGAAEDQDGGHPGQDPPPHGSRDLAPRLGLIIAIAIVLLPLAGPRPASAEPLTAQRLHQASDDPDNYLIDGHYQRGTKRLARMRARGELPDTIAAGPCSFGLAGDPEVAYYVRTCP